MNQPNELRDAFEKWCEANGSVSMNRDDLPPHPIEIFDEFLAPAIEALEKIAGFAYGNPVDKTFDAREALTAIRSKLGVEG